MSQPPMSQPAYGPAPTGYTGYAPRPPKPPLSARARRGSWFAGGVSFSVLSLGWTLLLSALAVSLIGGLLVWIAGLIRVGGPNDADDRAFAEFFESVDLGAWLPLLIAGALVGLALMVLAFFLSRWILTAHDVSQPWAVTWAAAGIAVAASWVLNTIFSIGLQFLATFASGNPEPMAAGVGFAVAGVAVVILGTVAIGIFSWWWMAHVLRPRPEPQADPGR